MISDFLVEAQARGFIHQATDLEGLDAVMKSGRIVAYAGFDPTATSLHVGHLVPIMMLRLLQRKGHKPIVIMGGATAKIGDPSFKNEMRKMLSDEQITENMASIKSVFEAFLTFGPGGNNAIMLNNAQWLDQLAYLNFLRDFGVHITVNRLLTFDTIKTRLDNNLPLSFLEFNYMLFQAYDFYHLHKHFNCVLQIGGSDQWANILNGVEFVRRISQKTAYGLTTPLLTTASGAKMGKTENGAVWLNADLMSDYDFWQFWRNTHDDDVIRFLKLFTDLPLSQIDSYAHLKGQELNDVKKLLADEVTKIVRGDQSLMSIHETTAKLFEQEAQAYTITTVDDKGNPTLETSLPVIDVPAADLPSLTAFASVVKAGLAESNGEARRLIRGKGVKIQDKVIEDENLLITNSSDHVIKVSVGKKKNALLRIVV
jgi:tyrosyl-tRNA synthetase